MCISVGLASARFFPLWVPAAALHREITNLEVHTVLYVTEAQAPYAGRRRCCTIESILCPTGVGDYAFLGGRIVGRGLSSASLVGNVTPRARETLIGHHSVDTGVRRNLIVVIP